MFGFGDDFLSDLTAPQISVAEDPELAEVPAHSVTRQVTQKIIDEAEHPLIPLLKVAQAGFDYVDQNVSDYTATIVSQVRTGDTLHEQKYMFCKLRHEVSDEGNPVPLSIYTCFLKPKSVAGQEAIWVRGQNDGKIIAHGSGLLNVKRLYLDRNGPIAMMGNRYSIDNLGMKGLVKKMIQKGRNDLSHGECIATVHRGVILDGHKCTVMEIKHPVKRDHFEFHIAKVYIDDERNLPIGYEGYLWPAKEGDEPPLLEKYYYTDIQLNVGLTDSDFDPGNEGYKFPKW